MCLTVPYHNVHKLLMGGHLEGVGDGSSLLDGESGVEPRRRGAHLVVGAGAPLVGVEGAVVVVTPQRLNVVGGNQGHDSGQRVLVHHRAGEVEVLVAPVQTHPQQIKVRRTCKCFV